MMFKRKCNLVGGQRRNLEAKEEDEEGEGEEEKGEEGEEERDDEMRREPWET